MDHYCFRAMTPDGKIMFETKSPAETLGEAVAVGLRTAGEVKSRQPLDVLRHDPFGCWLMSLPLAMMSRQASPTAPLAR